MHYSRIIKIGVLLMILCFGGWKGFVFLEQNSCLDNGNVWDYDENRCREDCLAWNEINGCIKMTDEQIKLFKKCRHQPAGCISKDVFNSICLQNHLPLNQATGECDAEFTLDKCHKLGENWIYPKICNE